MARVRMPIWRSGVLLTALLFGWAAGASAQAASDQKKPKKVKSEQLETDEPESQDAEANHKGMQAYVDSDTGKLRKPNPAEERRLAEELAKIVNDSHEGLTPVELADGSVVVDLEGRFMNVSVASVGSGGKVSLDCGSTLREALDLILHGPSRKPHVSVERSKGAAKPSAKKDAKKEKAEVLDEK